MTLEEKIMAVLVKERTTTKHFLADTHEIVDLCEAENAKLRTEVEGLCTEIEKLEAINNTLARRAAGAELQNSERDQLITLKNEQIVELTLQNGAWEKLVRAAADQLYALGKHLRGEDAATGTTLQVISTELHRECQVIKGEDPLPHAGGRLTEKQECEHRWISLANRMQACEKCPATRSLQP